MKITFSLGWINPSKLAKKSFKHAALAESFEEYLGRIGKFTAIRTGAFETKSGGVRVWLCDRENAKAPVSSEKLAELLDRELSQGTKELRIMIGGPDGLSKKEVVDLAPDFIWSFGPVTLPHELAAVVAAEQIYRAFTILKNLPYHLSH